ncbi:nucleoporin Nup120/160-domain-containing protein [Phlebopus sp. FC_14]|nr:nucleoporin Nup120/160-domain-containing protein [Phlebopus sp. FC_14]
MATGRILVATQLSSLFSSSSAPSVVLQTSRPDVAVSAPLTDGDLHPEHASFAFISHSQHTGSILLRVIHGGLIVELISLSTQVPPIRLVFPVPILPAPAVFECGAKELHLLAVTVTGSLYRLVLPIGNLAIMWHDQVGRNWCREYTIKNATQISGAVVHVQDIQCVAIGLPNGSLLRIEAERIGDDNWDDLWIETLSQPTSFLGTFTSYLPGLHSGAHAAPEILSVASDPEPTEVGYVWTLSRDRTLRLWTEKSGCVASKSLSSPPIAQATSSGGSKSDLLAPEPRNLLRICSIGLNNENKRTFAITFTPTPADPRSGGYFHVFDSSSDQLRELRIVACSSTSLHCHLQDFIVKDGVLYTLWERQGSSMVERINLGDEIISGNAAWETANYGEETELTPGYVEELLLSPGSLTDKFMNAIMRPGLFSPLTIRTALEQYVDACLSLPGPPLPELTASYPTVPENIAAVVGCTVTLVRDPHTGAAQHDRYWSALRRDWEGFVSRCREVERSARWPLALCVGENGEDVILVERERVATFAKEDLAITVHRHLSDSLAVESHFAVLDTVWTLCDKLGQDLLRALESNLVDLLHQEIAFSIVDIVGDQAQHLDIKSSLDEGTQNWIVGRLQEAEDLDRDIRIILDLVAGFDPGVKREEDEVELLLPSARPEWRIALSATYVSVSVHARYDICIALMALLFFLAEDLSEWDPSLLEEIFAVFRGLAILRYIARQPAVDQTSGDRPSDDAATTDDVVMRMSNMQVSRNHVQFAPNLSLLHRLMARSGQRVDLPNSAHQFLDATGLLQSTSPAHVTHFEVLFCEQLRRLGYCQVSRDTLGWLPRTPAVAFVTSLLWINLGRADDAAHMLEKIAGSFGPDSGLSFEDAEALVAVLPGNALLDSEFAFYLEASSIFRTSGLTQHEVAFLRLALSVAPHKVDTGDLWYGLIRGYIDLAFWEEAYASIMAAPFDSVRRDCVSQLVYQMCEENAIEQLVSLDFAGIGSEVDDALAFKARNTDPRARPFYSRILYTWYTRRGDHRSAARTMYHRACKLQEIAGQPADVISLMEDRLESYLLAINSLSLLEPKNAWMVVQGPLTDIGDLEPRKRRKLARNLPVLTSSGNCEIIDLQDLRYEQALLSARLRLIRRDPALLAAPDALLSPSLTILRLGQANQFDLAMSTARTLNVDMSELFAMLVGKCMRLSRNPEAVLQEDTSDWLLTDNVSSWPGTPAERGWRYLKIALERHDSMETDYRYTKATLEAILSYDRATPPPPWLIHSLEDHHHEYLIRTTLRFDIIESALEHTLSLVRKVFSSPSCVSQSYMQTCTRCIYPLTGTSHPQKKAESKLSRSPPKTACSTWLPYTLIDQVLVAAAGQEKELSARGLRLWKELQTEVNNRVKQMQKMSLFSSK